MLNGCCRTPDGAGRAAQAQGTAVLIRNAYKEYRTTSLMLKSSRNMVIKGLNMTVRRGTM